MAERVAALPAARAFPPRRLAVAALAAVATALAIGVPTDVIDTPLFGRMTPVRAWDYPLLVATSILSGLLLATWSRGGSCPVRLGERSTLGGGILGFLAVGCPTCNHLVVLALGSAGALTWFEPLQPVLGVASLAVLALALRSRLRAGA